MSQSHCFLLVDDDPIFLAVAEGIIDAMGDHEITVAQGGTQGLAALRANAGIFDYIILDLNMPDLDGLSFLRGASELGFHGAVIISSGEHEAVLRSAQRMGELLRIRVIGALKKPLTMASLTKLLADTPREEPKLATAKRPPLPGQADGLELVPYYQAQHDAWDGSVKSLEALIRARTPDGNIHGPDKLFALIHDHEELVSAALAITGKVLDDLQRWVDEGRACRVSVNIDAALAEDPAVSLAIMEDVKSRGIDPSLVCIELTERALPQDLTRLIEALARFRIAGFHVSLDDYGAGGANFELLRLCPFTELKIDGAVLRAAPDEPVALRFLESVIAMATELDIEVVGEGVETTAQLEVAQQSGIKTIQGYLFSKPMSAADIENKFLRPKTLPY